jgi:hypothetical protein
MKRLLGSASVVALLVGGDAAVMPAQAQNASQCAPVAPPGVPNGGVLAVAAGQVAGPVAVRCSMVASTARPLYWGARTSSAWDIVGTRMVNGAPVSRVIASGQSALANDGMPNGNTFNAFAGETLTVTIYATCTQDVCVAEGMAGVGG